MPDPGRRLGLLAEFGACLRQTADCLVDLVDRPRHDGPEEAGDEPDEHGVVEPDPGDAREPALREPLDRRPHRCREDEGEEEERDEELQLPERRARAR